MSAFIAPVPLRFYAHHATTCNRTARISMNVSIQDRTSVTRRTMLTLLTVAPIAMVVDMTLAGDTENMMLARKLMPLINLRDSLDALATDISTGTNGDVRRTVRTLQRGLDITSAIKAATKAVPSAEREDIRIHGRDAVEFLDQVVQYYDSTALKQTPPAEVMSFSLRAVECARAELDKVLILLDPSVVTAARKMVYGE